MIAVQMNDEPLPRAHGYPARLIVPGLFGYVSATKWLCGARAHDVGSRSTGTGCRSAGSKEAPILTQSRIDTPRGPIAAGQVPIAGVAWAPDRGIAKVEVGIDDDVAGRRSLVADLGCDLGPVGPALGRHGRSPHDLRARDRWHRRTPGADPVAACAGRGARVAHDHGPGRLVPVAPADHGLDSV